MKIVRFANSRTQVASGGAERRASRISGFESERARDFDAGSGIFGKLARKIQALRIPGSRTGFVRERELRSRANLNWIRLRTCELGTSGVTANHPRNAPSAQRAVSGFPETGSSESRKSRLIGSARFWSLQGCKPDDWCRGAWFGNGCAGNW